MSARRLFPVAAAVLAVALAAAARADWLQPDPSYRDAQMELRLAARDTVDAPPSAARLDTLAFAHLRLGNLDQARALFERVLASSPGDEAASAGLGRLALFGGDDARAESLLARGADRVPGAAADLFHARLRRGDWAGAAGLADAAGEPGRAALLNTLAGPDGCWRIEGPDVVTVSWVRALPVPLVRVELNGERVLFAIDTGVADLLLDESAARRCHVLTQPEQTSVPWSGTRVAARNALVQRVALGGLRFERVPAGVTTLRRWSLDANPGGERVAGIIGANLLARFTPTLDYRKGVLILRRGAAVEAGAGALRIPFQLWGERELTVYGSINGGRRMAMEVTTGMPLCDVGAPREVFEEVGLKAGKAASAARSAGLFLQGQRWAAVEVPTVTVGPLTREKAHGCSGAMDSAELWRHGVRRDAFISSDFLRNKRVTIAWDSRELVVE